MLDMVNQSHSMQLLPAHGGKACKTDLTRPCLQFKPWPAELMRAASELRACKSDSWTASVFEALRIDCHIICRLLVQGVAGEVWGSVV